MNTAHTAPARRTGTRRSGARATLLIIPALAGTFALTGCSSGSKSQTASDVVNKLGAVPIPTAPATQITPSADETHPQLVAIGSPVSVHLPGGDAIVTALGPTEDLPTPAPATPPKQVAGTITIRIAATSGSVTVNAADLSSRDDHGNDITLTPTGPAQGTATNGATTVVSVSGTFQAGAAQITWRHEGHVIAVWDFNIELD